MSGKAKQANRTKNNVRPSSSGRSAGLLSSTVNPALMLVGPGNLLPAVFPTLGGTTIEEPLSNEFLLCFKKFHKKDPITKIKALNELKDLVAKSEQSEVVKALASWAHYYPSLTVDVDRKVREATQTVHGAIVRKCGRQVALHIKRLLPAWLMAQHDEHAPVQRIAHADLHSTFPNTKLMEAIKFCKTDICNLYMDNLKGNAEYMLSGKKIDDEEERAAQVARVVSGTLRAMELLVVTLTAEQLGERRDEQQAWLWDALLPLLCANTFWKLAAHAAPAVRASFYALTGAVLEAFAARLPPELARRCARTLAGQAERAPAVCAQRWRTLLKFMFHVENFLELLDNKDLLFKRWWDVFENAAWGEAAQLAAVLPALLDMVPAEMRSEGFYDKLFAALFMGLRQKTLLTNESEREVWNGIVADCLRCVSARHRREQYAGGVLGRAHGAWLHALLTLPDFPGKMAFVRSTATPMAEVVTCWAEMAEDTGEPMFERVVDGFWQNVSAPAADLERLPADADDVVKLIDAQMQLVIALKRALDSRAPTGGAARERCVRALGAAAEALAGSVMHAAHARRLVRRVLPAVMPLLAEFPGPSPLRSLARKFEAESLFEFYDTALKAWLADRDQWCETAVELVFLLLQHLDDEEQNALLDSFGELSPEVVRWGLALALRAARGGGGAGAAGAAAARWLRSAAAERALVALVRLHEHAPERDLLLAALAHHDAAEPVVSDNALTGIVSACTEMLNTLIAHDPEITLPAEAARTGRAAGRGAGGAGGAARGERPDPFASLEPRVSFAAQLLHALPAERAPVTLPLLLSLFRLTLHIPRGSPRLAAEAWTDALWAWREAAGRLPRARRTAFVRDALRHLHWHLFHDLEQLNIKRIEHVVSLCPYFVIAEEQRAPADPGELVAHSRLLLRMEAEGRPAPPPLELFALQLDVVWGDLSCPFERDNEWVAAAAAGETALDKPAAVTHAYRALFRAAYVRTVLLHPAPPGTAPPTWCDDIIRVDYFRDQFCDVLHDYAVINVLYDHYAFWEHYDIIRETKERMEAIVSEVVAQIPADMRDVLAATLHRRAVARGYYWAYARHHYQRALASTERTPESLAEPADDDELTLESALASLDASGAERADSRQSHSSSFEILDTFETIGTGTPSEVADLDAYDCVVDAKPVESVGRTDDARVTCDCHRLHLSVEEVFSPLLQDAKGESGEREPGAPRPDIKLGSECEAAAAYADRLGEIMLQNGYFHVAQMKALEVKKRKLMAKAKFDRLQDSGLCNLQVNGQYKIFEKWNDEPAAYRLVGVDVDESALYTGKEFAMLRAFGCAYGERAPRLDELLADVAAESAQGHLDAVINGYYRHNDTMLFERSLQGASWLELNATASVLDLLCEAVTVRGWDAAALHWDFTNIALCSALSSLALSARMWLAAPLRLALVARPALELFVRVRRFIGSVRRQCTRRLPSAHVAALPREWADIFAPDATAHIHLLICHVLDHSSRTVTAAQAAILRSLTDASKQLEASALPAVLRAGRLTLERAVRSATRALAEPCHHGFKYLAYYTLRSLAPAMIEIDEARLAEHAKAAAARAADAGADEDVALSDLTLALYDEHLDQLQELVDAALSNYALFEDICEVAPHSDSHAVVLGYLLLCVALHRHCELAAGDLALHYDIVFNAHSYVEGILPAALRLLPPAAVHYMAGRVPALPKRLLPWFIRLQDFDLADACSGEAVSRLACGAVLRALGGPGGAAARGWWAVRRARHAAALARLVSAAVAPPLVNHQLAELQARVRELGEHAKVSVCWSARSAACALRGEDEHGEGGRSPALRVSLGAAHPLHAPRVVSAAPGPDPHWIARYLGFRNGRLIDAMKMWLEVVSAERRDGVHCYVCYCRVEPHEPRVSHDGAALIVSCHQCRNLFHAQCLRRWFKTSNRSNCPLCRTNF